MYFNGKSYFNQEQNMRVIRNQKNPPPRRKGRTKKKVIKRKVDSKVDMRKFKKRKKNKTKKYENIKRW